MFEKKRQEAVLRESMRWEHMEAAQQAEAERMQHVREAGLKGKQNKSSEHYNIISLEYHPTREGQQLRHKVGGLLPGTCCVCGRVATALAVSPNDDAV